MRDGGDYCMQRVRIYDYDRYFASIFAPRDVRSDLMALYAFNLEIASTNELVSEALLGQMRLEWWRDAVAAIYEGRTIQHVVVAELNEVVRRHDLPQAEMDGLIAARSRDLDESPMETVAAVEDYARGSAGVLAGLAYRICCGSVPPPEIWAAGTAWGLAGLLRAASFNAVATNSERPGGPVRDIDPAGPNTNSATSGSFAAGLADEMAERARQTLAVVRDQLAGMARPSRAAIGYLPVARQYLARLERVGNNILAPDLEPSRTARQFGMLKAIVIGRL